MRNRILIAMILATAVMSASAQTFVTPKDEAATRKKFAEATKAITSIKSDFVQEKNLKMLSEKVVSKGTFYFSQKNKVRLEYKQPFKYLLVMNNGKVMVRDDSKTTQMDMHKNKIFQSVNNIIVGSVQGDALNNPDFAVKLNESATQLRLDMKPVVKGMKEFFSNIVIFIDKKDYTVQRMEMNETGGDNTVITFMNKEINGKIADDFFSVLK